MTKLTQIDLALAKAYFPILVNIAKSKELITYGKLVELAKSTYPDNAAVQNAIPVSTGRRLDVVRMFTNQCNCPDLSALVINDASGECGPGYLRNFDPEAVRNQISDFDWNQVHTDFEGFISTTEAKIKLRKRVKEADALLLMATYYKANKDSLPNEIRTYRESLIALIMDGIEVKEAFDECVSQISN